MAPAIKNILMDFYGKIIVGSAFAKGDPYEKLF